MVAQQIPLPTEPPDRPAQPLRLRHGWFLDNAPEDTELLHFERMRAAQRDMGPGSYFARSSAALVHGLPVFHADLTKPHVVRTLGGHGQITDVQIGYKTPKDPPNIVVIDGFEVTSLARTAGDLMRRTLFGPALAIADAALRLGCERGELLREVEKWRGCRHSTEAARRADGLSDSPYESLTRAQFLQNGIPLPVLQHEFFDAAGLIGRADFYWPAFGLIGEFDGAVKYSTLLTPGETPEMVLRRQEVRQQRLEALGYHVVRWTSDDVHTPCAIEESLSPFLGNFRVSHGMCPEAHDYRRPRNRRR